MTTPNTTLKRGLTALALSTAALLLWSAPALAAAPETPEVTVQAPVHATEATFHGVLDPGGGGELGTYEFVYKEGAKCEGGTKVPESPGIASPGRQEPSQTVTGLKPGTLYTVCLLARNGTKVGENEVSSTEVPFTTATPAEAPETLSPATLITPGTATLHGVLNPAAEAETGWYFAYSTGATCTSGGGETSHEPPAKVKALAVEREVGGLEPNKFYKFCLVATDIAEEPTPGNEVSFETLPLPPEYVFEYTNGVTASAATLNAEINPENENTKYKFEYSTKASGEPLLLEAPIAEEPGAAELTGFPQQLGSVALSALAPNTTYYYRVVAENKKSEEEGNPVVGPVQQFTTAATPTTEAVTAITATTATFNGHLSPLNPTVAAQYNFDYRLGSECAGENGTSVVEAGTGAGTEVQATASVTGLQPRHEYTVCLFTYNVFGGFQEGAPVHFTTPAVPLEVLSETVSGVTPSEATLEAQVNPNNYKTTYTFEYSTDPTLTTGVTVLPGGALEGFGSQTASAPTGAVLSVGETYYYRVVVTNTETSEVLKGAIQSFTPQGPPLLTIGEAQNITRTTATLPGMVNPAGVETFYHYQYGTSTSYGGNAPSIQGVSAGSGFSAVPASVGISGLVPGTLYHYRMVATNTEGTTTEKSPDQTFTTALSTPPAVTTGEASNITLTTATVAGTINPEGLETSYELDLGTDTSYGTSLYGEAGSANTPTQITIGLQNLAPASTYHYRLDAINSDGRTYGADRTFTTPAYNNPIVQPLTLPLIASPAIAFPTETTNTTKTHHQKHTKSKHKKHKHKKKHKKSR
jgi:hypothetical protein